MGKKSVEDISPEQFLLKGANIEIDSVMMKIAATWKSYEERHLYRMFWKGYYNQRSKEI